MVVKKKTMHHGMLLFSVTGFNYRGMNIHFMVREEFKEFYVFYLLVTQLLCPMLRFFFATVKSWMNFLLCYLAKNHVYGG